MYIYANTLERAYIERAIAVTSSKFEIGLPETSVKKLATTVEVVSTNEITNRSKALKICSFTFTLISCVLISQIMKNVKRT